MGCDIHFYKEKRVDGKWVTADEWETEDYGDGETYTNVPWKKRFTDRSYQLFGLLSKGVRTEHPYSFEQRGMPFNASPEVATANESYGADGHSHSYLYLHELKDLRDFLSSKTIKIEGMKDADELKGLQATIDAGAPNWDLLFPYCRWTNANNSVHFELDVPATFYLGGSLDKIIASFDGLDGDNHRAVFWFDN